MKYLSLCSGIEAISQGWMPLGFTPVAFAEIEPFPCAVLHHHHPDVPNLGDMTRFREWGPALLAAADVLVGGCPCQAFSVAGLGKSMADARGQLTMTFIQILNAIDEARNLSGRPPALCLYENVPGIFSKSDNPFGCLLGGLAGESEALHPPRGKWADAGYVRGPRRNIAWRVLDAQYFGLAQRRERVFVVASTRGGPCPWEILFVEDGVRRDSPPSREAGQRPAGTLSARSQGGGGLGTDFELAGGLQPVAAPVTTRPYADNLSQEGSLIPVRQSGIPETARCVTTGEGKRQDWETCTIIACEDHAGHGATAGADPAHPIAFPANLSGTACASTEDLSPALCSANPTAVAFDLNQVTSPANRSNPQAGGPCHTLPASSVPPVVAFSGRARGDDGRGYDRPPQVFGDVAGCLDTVKPHCVALSVALRGRDGGGTAELGDDVAGALRASQGGGDKAHVLAFRACGQDGFTPRDLSPPVMASRGGGAGVPSVATQYAVRRITPREAERLQGFPGDHTLIRGLSGWRDMGPEENSDELKAGGFRVKQSKAGKWRVNDPDGPRYKAIGNSMAIPVVAWIGKRLLAVAASGPPAPHAASENADTAVPFRETAPDLNDPTA